MPFEHRIKNINKSLRMINYYKCTSYYEFKIIFESPATGKRDTYLFSMSSLRDGSECIFGSDYYDTADICEDQTCRCIFKEIPKDEAHTLSESERYIGKIVDNIRIYEETGPDPFYDMMSNTERYMTIMSITFSDATAIHLVFSNIHNGYYSHDVTLDLHENSDAEPITIVRTCI